MLGLKLLNQKERKEKMAAAYEKMKKLNVSRGVIIISSTFSRKAVEYAESRPIDLVSKDELMEHLKNIDFTALQ